MDSMSKFLSAAYSWLMQQTVAFLQLTLSYLCRSHNSAPGSHIPEPSDECRRKFEQWWSLQLTQHQQQHQHHGPQHHPMPRPQSGSQYSPGGSSHHTSTPNKLLDRPPSLPESVHPALQVSDLLAYCRANSLSLNRLSAKSRRWLTIREFLLLLEGAKIFPDILEKMYEA
jgi:hypothetical protein